MFYDKMCVVRFEIVENDGKKKVFSLGFGFLALSTSLRDLAFSILHFESEIAVVAC